MLLRGVCGDSSGCDFCLVAVNREMVSRNGSVLFVWVGKEWPLLYCDYYSCQLSIVMCLFGVILNNEEWVIITATLLLIVNSYGSGRHHEMVGGI